MLEVSNVRLPLDAGLSTDRAHELVREAAARACGVSASSVERAVVVKRSVDARKKTDVHFVATVAVALSGGEEAERAAVARGARGGASLRLHAPYEPLSIPRVVCDDRPIVVGTGPAGLFCALYLARAGARPLVVERGSRVEERLRAIESFAAGGPLDLSSNVQFGEGGAGTFSDGKLTTNTKNPFTKHVLRWFVEAGAPEEILWQGKPHIGTDLLRDVVRTLRAQIVAAGGEVLFNTQLTGLRFDGGRVSGAELADLAAGRTRSVPCSRVVVACGHSARDTFAMLRDAGLAMEQKPFSVGVRIEHEQRLVNRAQYGSAAGHPALGAADYKLAVHLDNGRGVYTFCMCPGGEVVAAASEEHAVCVNGMSEHARAGQNANSALLVSVEPSDFGSDDVLAGVEFQRRIERAAYECAVRAGGAPYAAPAQTVGDFLAGVSSDRRARVAPSYPRGVAWCDLRECLPGFVSESLAQALPLMDRKMAGFADPGAVMTGVETRSSSPVRIVRARDLQAHFAGTAQKGAFAASGVYPCGEGAGYAGGIMSAAVDGLRVGAAIAEECGA